MNLADAQSRINALFGYEPSEAELLARPDLIDIAIEAVRASVINVSQLVTALNTFFDAEYTADDLKQRVDLLKIGMAILAADNTGDGGGGGGVVQTQFTHLTTTSSQSLPVNTSIDITGMSCAITPTSATSKILVQVRWEGATSGSSGVMGNQLPYGFVWQIKRNGTLIGNPATDGNKSIGLSRLLQPQYVDPLSGTPWCFFNAFYLDSPNSTSEFTYTLGAFSKEDSDVIYTNYAGATDNDSGNVKATSSILLMEIAP